MMILIIAVLILLSLGAQAAAITAGAGLLSGMMGNKGAQDAANSAAADRSKLADRATALFDKQFGLAETADQGGLFDPTHRIASMESEGAKGLGVAQRVASADALDGGYNAGDSAVAQTKDNLKLRFAQSLAAGKDALTQQSFFDKQRAYGAANVGDLTPGINNDNLNQQIAMSQYQNPAGLISGMIQAWPGSGGRAAVPGGGARSPFGFNPNYSLNPFGGTPPPAGGAGFNPNYTLGGSSWKGYFGGNK